MANSSNGQSVTGYRCGLEKGYRRNKTMTDPMAAHVIGNAIGKLVDRLARLQEQLAKSTGDDADRLWDEIDKLERHIEQAERMQERYL